MSTNQSTINLATELAKLNGSKIRLSERKFLTHRYVETCHSINSRNQLHIEFISNTPISLNPKYVATITNYVENLQVKVYDIHSNLRDRVYVYGYPKKPTSPVAIVKAVTENIRPISPKRNLANSSTSLQGNPAVKETTFNGQTHLTPIVFVKQSTPDESKCEIVKDSAPVTELISSNTKEDRKRLTEDGQEKRDKQPVTIPTVYTNIMYYRSRLTDNDTFNRLRRFLSCYTLPGGLNSKDLRLFNESESYLSLKMQLLNDGLPSDEIALRNLYYDFLTEKGFLRSHIDDDLEKLKRHYDNTHMIRSNQVKTNFKTYYYGDTNGHVRYITEGGRTHTSPGRSVPDTCVVV